MELIDGLLKLAINEIERSMLGNKSREVNNFYLNNAIRYIKASGQPILNENQQNLLTWMQEVDCDTDDPLEPIVDLFCETLPDGTAWESCLQASYSKLNGKQKLELVQGYITKRLEQEDE